MPESKIELTERLRREGRFSEANVFRDEERKRLRGEGMPRKEANEKAWALMAEEFPPLPEPEDTADHGDDDEPEHDRAELDTLYERTKDQPLDIYNDVLWCYRHLLTPVKPAEAPSSGAWGMLMWARSSRDQFYRQMLPKALAELERTKPPEEPEEPDPDAKITGEDDPAVDFILKYAKQHGVNGD